MAPSTGRRTNLKPLIAGALALAVLVEAFLLLGGPAFLQKGGGLASVLPGVVALLTNEARTGESLNPLSENALLQKGAQLKANDMAAKGYFSHTGPDGAQPWKWFAQAGYRYEYAGENLAVNFDESEDVVNAWLKSPTHRANILKHNFTEIGVGVATGTYKGKEAVFVVQFFGKPSTIGTASALGADGSRVPADAFLHSGEVLGTSTSIAEQFLTSPLSSEKQVFYMLLGLLVIAVFGALIFGRFLAKLIPTIIVLIVLAFVLGYALVHKDQLLGTQGEVVVQ